MAEKELATVATTPETLLEKALASGLAPEAMERFYELYQKMTADRQRQHYTKAMADFKAKCPAISRKTQNAYFKRKIVDRNGVSRDVPTTYASLEDIGETIRKPLEECGLSYRFDGLKVEGDMVTLNCVVSHVGGHSERSPVSLPYKSNAGCSDQQKMGAAMTYAQRYSLIQALGLTTCEEDVDGNDGTATGEPITEEQAANIRAAVEGIGGDTAKFLKWLGVSKFTEIPAARYSEALKAIEDKRKGKK